MVSWVGGVLERGCWAISLKLGCYAKPIGDYVEVKWEAARITSGRRWKSFYFRDAEERQEEWREPAIPQNANGSYGTCAQSCDVVAATDR